MAKKKFYRRFVRLNGQLVPSPRFDNKADADDWYDKMRRRNKFAKFNLMPEIRQSDMPTFMELAAPWMLEREKEYGANTTAGEDRNLRNHILPVLGLLPINQVTHKKIEKFLKQLTVTKVLLGGNTVKAKADPSTKKKIKSLLSSFFESLLDEEYPIVDHNPVKLVRENRGPRKAEGQKLPANLLPDDEACLRFIEAAKKLGMDARWEGVQSVQSVKGRAFVYASCMLMLGLRISELMALRWSYVDFKTKLVKIAWSYERESKSLKQRTKKGENEARLVPLPEMLAQILLWWKDVSPYSKPSDFIISKPGGGFMSYRTVRQMHERICKHADVEISRHALRHTFGRLFAKKTGNLKALQDILGHSSSKTTEIYAKLDAGHLQEFSKGMEIDTQNSPLTPPKLQSKRSKRE